jgi:hypothetical protein
MILLRALLPPPQTQTTLILAPGVIGGSVISCIVMDVFSKKNKRLNINQILFLF